MVLCWVASVSPAEVTAGNTGLQSPTQTLFIHQRAGRAHVAEARIASDDLLETLMISQVFMPVQGEKPAMLNTQRSSRAQPLVRISEIASTWSPRPSTSWSTH